MPDAAPLSCPLPIDCCLLDSLKSEPGLRIPEKIDTALGNDRFRNAKRVVTLARSPRCMAGFLFPLLGGSLWATSGIMMGGF